jgi:hypothetical protein
VEVLRYGSSYWICILYCHPVKHGAWSHVVENVFGVYTLFGIDTLVVCISYLALFGVCFYRIWRTTRDYTMQQFKLSSPYYNYLLGLLVVYYCIAEPIYRIATGTSITNLDEQPGLAPFEVRWLYSISLMLIWYPSILVSRVLKVGLPIHEL